MDTEIQELYSKVNFRPSDDISFADEDIIHSDNVMNVVQGDDPINNNETSKFNTVHEDDKDINKYSHDNDDDLETIKIETQKSD